MNEGHELDTGPGTGTDGLVKRAQSIIMAPAQTWPQVAGEKDAPMQVFTRYVIPLALIAPVAGFIGGQLFGFGAFGVSFKPSLMGGLTQAVTQFVLSLIGVWIVAWVANFLSPKFEGRDDFPAAFRLVAYAMTAVFLVGIFQLIPMLGILGLLGLYSLYLFYRGAQPVMGVPESKAIGYTAVTVIVAVIINIVLGAISAALIGGAAMTGRLASASSDAGSASIDMGDYGSIDVSKDGSKATIKLDGKEMTIDVPKEDE